MVFFMVRPSVSRSRVGRESPAVLREWDTAAPQAVLEAASERRGGVGEEHLVERLAVEVVDGPAIAHGDVTDRGLVGQAAEQGVHGGRA